MNIIQPPSTPSLIGFVRAWNDAQGQSTPRHHLDIAEWLERSWLDGRRQLVLLAFRSAGKSTMVGLYCAWLLRLDPGIRILVLAADWSLARKMVRNVKRIIERHPDTGHLMPRRADQWASDQFTVNREAELRDPSMLAQGITGNITGSRADVVVCDDVEVPRTCDTAPKRRDLRDRLGEIDYVLAPGGAQLYIGTPHAFDSIYKIARLDQADGEQAFLDGFHRLEIPLIGAEGSIAWPERFTPEAIEDIRRRTGPNKFKSQMMLEPVRQTDCRLDASLLRLYDEALDYREANGEPRLFLRDRRLLSASGWWDPALGGRDGGDASVVACVFSDGRGGYWLHDIEYHATEPFAECGVDEATQLCRAVAAFAERNRLPAVTVETNGIGGYLPGLLKREMRAAGVACAVKPHHSTRPKDIRILNAFDTLLAVRALNVRRSVIATRFAAELRDWRPGARGPDDGLDAVAGCLLSEPVRFSAYSAASMPAPRSKSWRGAPGRLVATVEFDV